MSSNNSTYAFTDREGWLFSTGQVCLQKLWVSPESGPLPKLDCSFSGRGMIVSPFPTLLGYPSEWWVDEKQRIPLPRGQLSCGSQHISFSLLCKSYCLSISFQLKRAPHVSQHRHSLITVRVSLYIRLNFANNHKFPCSIFASKFQIRPCFRYSVNFHILGIVLRSTLISQMSAWLRLLDYVLT